MLKPPILDRCYSSSLPTSSQSRPTKVYMFSTCLDTKLYHIFLFISDFVGTTCKNMKSIVIPCRRGINVSCRENTSLVSGECSRLRPHPTTQYRLCLRSRRHGQPKSRPASLINAANASINFSITCCHDYTSLKHISLRRCRKTADICRECSSSSTSLLAVNTQN